MNIAKIIAMRCPGCGANLDISQDMNSFNCGYCGATIGVVRNGGTVKLEQITDSVIKIQNNTDRTAAELALVRLEKEKVQISQRLDNILEEESSIKIIEPPFFGYVYVGRKFTSELEYFIGVLSLGLVVAMFGGSAVFTIILMICFSIPVINARSERIKSDIRNNESNKERLEQLEMEEISLFERQEIVDNEISNYKRIVKL